MTEIEIVKMLTIIIPMKHFPKFFIFVKINEMV